MGMMPPRHWALRLPARRGGAGLPAALLAIALVLGFEAAACQRLTPGDQTLDANRPTPNLDRPDYYFGGTGGFIDKAYRCQPGTETFLIDMPLTGLTYVRDIQYENGTFAAYRMSARSPLIGFQYQLQGMPGLPLPTPLHPGQINRTGSIAIPATAEISAGVVVLFFFPGGAMESVPYHHLGTLISWPESDPSQRMLHSVSLGFNVPPVTCSLVDRAVTLADVPAAALAAVGSTPGEIAFDMMMACPSANVDVTLSLADANDPGNTGSVLAPSAATTASGVQVQLLRGGAPVHLQQSWHYGYSSKGDQPVEFSARYLRTAAPLQAGVVEGQAVLTATYR